MYCVLPPFLFAPVSTGERAGIMSVSADDGACYTVEMVCGQDIPALDAGRVWREIADRLIGICAV